jgi:hypothetical protein
MPTMRAKPRISTDNPPISHHLPNHSNWGRIKHHPYGCAKRPRWKVSSELCLNYARITCTTTSAHLPLRAYASLANRVAEWLFPRSLEFSIREPLDVRGTRMQSSCRDRSYQNKLISKTHSRLKCNLPLTLQHSYHPRLLLCQWCQPYSMKKSNHFTIMQEECSWLGVKRRCANTDFD